MKKNTLSVIILAAGLLLAVMLAYTGALFSQTRDQARRSGSYQLESVSGKLEGTIADAQILTMIEGARALEFLDDEDALTDFLCSEKARIVAGGSGAFNIYAGGEDFLIIPDFDIPDDYSLNERVWYIGALKNGGDPYVSSPYQDAVTGDICYSVSMLLNDGKTVIGMDYTMENIQRYISQMGENAVRSVIVTDEGIIAGCSDAGLVGEKLVNAIPDYAGIYTGVKNSDGVTSGRIKSGLRNESLFATKSGNGWYLIVTVRDLELYRDSYAQLFTAILLSLAFFAVIISLYISSIRSREKAERALVSREDFLSRITGQLSEPLNRIRDRSCRNGSESIDDYEADMAAIHAASGRLSEMISQIISYKSLASYDDPLKETRKMGGTGSLNERFRAVILIIMVVVMLLSLFINISATYHWGNIRMANEADAYEYELSEWIDTQKGILDMFVSVISTNPEMLDDYDKAIDYLNRITVQYPEISVTYMTNPAFEHTVYMNNGWEPSDDWHVEERQWYIDTIASKSGWSISSPYYDEQTGGYCVTISEIVYDSRTGEFLGVFGIDFFMDKLVNILGDSYSENGYAFLVDSEGKIINHPYGAYQMSQEHETLISQTPYDGINADGNTTRAVRDYDGAYRILISTRDADSNFIVYVAYNAWMIYNRVVISGFVCLAAFSVCIILVYRLLGGLIKWQDETNLRLTEAADAAIAAGKAKSSFLAQMSHEIRTPINAVLGMNEMILRETDSDNIKDYAGNIQSSGKTLLSIINSILDFSKIEDGKMELVPVKYDVSSFINDLVNSISERARAKDLVFDLDVDSDLPCTLFGDDVRIGQIIMNLLTNAVKYTDEGSVALKLAKKEISGNTLIMHVSVKDTGIGIKEEDRDRLFESFARLDEERNRNVEGTGLGMSIVVRLLAMMGSSLHMDSEYGKGSEFSFDLEQEIIDPTPLGNFSERLRRSAKEAENKTYLYAPGARLLIVDDNKVNLKVAASLMKRNGIVPDEAASGEEAIGKMSDEAYDIVLLDHMMPGMDGIETLKALKEQDLIPEGCAVIALTANAISGARDEYMSAGFDDYMPKPIDPAMLEDLLRKYIPREKISETRNDEENA